MFFILFEDEVMEGLGDTDWNESQTNHNNIDIPSVHRVRGHVHCVHASSSSYIQYECLSWPMRKDSS